MAAEKINPELEELAAEFAKASAAGNPRSDGTASAVAAFRNAAAFLAVRDKMRSGGLTSDKATGPQLADCCAPNLPKTHPHNMVSSRFGNLDRVQKVKAWLDAHPTPESEPETLIPDINRAFPEISWDLPTINTARTLFPFYCAN